MIDALFSEYGFSLNELQKEQFSKYREILLHYNEKFNLTAITDPYEIAVKHFLDSVVGEKFIPDGAAVVDIGSGAGFPAVPLKIYRPDLKITMLDSLAKRVRFLEEVIKILGFSNAESIHIRAEDAAKGTFRESFFVAVARAVAPLATLAEYALPLVKVGGKFIAYKGPDVEEELAAGRKAVTVLGGKIISSEKYLLPDGSGRSLIVIEKTAPTPAKYPRGQNKPRLSPIG